MEKKYSRDKARQMLSALRRKANACDIKLQKIGLRIGILETFINETRGKKVKFGKWLKDKGYDCKKLFPSLGYFTPIGQAVSYDRENQELKYHKGMQINPAIKGYVPMPNVVGSKHHKDITKAKLGMTFDPALQLYFPTTIYDTELYASAEGEGDEIIDMVGCYSSRDISQFSAFNDDSEAIIQNVIELYEEEYDNVEGEYDKIYDVAESLGVGEEFSYAESKAGRNALCRAGCNTKHPFSKKKRDNCKSECDKKFPPSEKQEDRREDRAERKEERQENREERKDARKDKRGAIKDCKAEYKAGKISKDEYKNCKKEQRDIKKERVKDAGGTFLARVGKGFAKVFPLTASARGGILLLTKMNAFGFATRVAPALIPEAEAKKKFKPEAITNGKKAWDKISRAFENMGGRSDKLKEAILKSYKKKASKVEKKASATGDNYTTFVIPEYSNLDPATATLIATGITALVSLIGILASNKVPKDPYLDGEAPDSWNESKNAVNEVPPPDPNEPRIDPVTGEWIDPETGKAIDPLTGAFKNEIFGMNKYLFYGLLGVGAVGIFFLVRKMMKK